MWSEQRPDASPPVEAEDKRRDIDVEYEAQGEHDDENEMKSSQEGVIRDQEGHGISCDHKPYRGREEKPRNILVDCDQTRDSWLHIKVYEPCILWVVHSHLAQLGIGKRYYPPDILIVYVAWTGPS